MAANTSGEWRGDKGVEGAFCISLSLSLLQNTKSKKFNKLKREKKRESWFPFFPIIDRPCVFRLFPVFPVW